MQADSGYVYALQNASFPGILKIGMTLRNPFERASELHTTGVPTPFFVAFCVFVPDAVRLERTLHTHFAAHRINANREFFKLELPELMAAVLPYMEGSVEHKLDIDAVGSASTTPPVLSIPANTLLLPDMNEDSALFALNGDDYFINYAEAARQGDNTALTA